MYQNPGVVVRNQLRTNSPISIPLPQGGKTKNHFAKPMQSDIDICAFHPFAEV